MYNILFVPSTREMEWVQDVLPGTSPSALPVAGRRMIDYQMECAQQFGVIFTEILDWRCPDAMIAEFAEMTRTGYPVFCIRGKGEVPMGLRDIEGYPSPLTANVTDGLVVVWGLVISTHEAGELTLEPVSDEELVRTPSGIYRRDGGRWMRILPRGLVVRGVRAWHALNFVILRFPRAFTLPGYRSERGVHLGRSVVLERGTVVKQPVLLSDHCWCARNVRLEGCVIVGSGSFIGEGSVLKRTIVGNDTYVGMGLELRDKIVVGNRVIDAKTGAWTDIEEPGLARRIGAAPGWLRSVWRFLRGRSHGRRG